MISALIGVLVPLIFHLLNIDPAVASGPFITTVVDISTLIIYFTFSVYFIDLISVGMPGMTSLWIKGVL